MTKENELTMCWFGFWQPYATSVVHVPSQEISPKEIEEYRLIFIWDKYMKSDMLTKLIRTPVPWSPALIEGYSREWNKNKDGSYVPELVKNSSGKCLGAVLLLSRVDDEQIKPLVKSYQKRGYEIKKTIVLIGDIIREIEAFLP
ncbi:MAG: hypothetical protein ACFFBP_19405 [Promethearchaeota archaeon]